MERGSMMRCTWISTNSKTFDFERCEKEAGLFSDLFCMEHYECWKIICMQRDGDTIWDGPCPICGGLFPGCINCFFCVAHQGAADGKRDQILKKIVVELRHEKTV
jgi:hypothetical protein